MHNLRNASRPRSEVIAGPHALGYAGSSGNSLNSLFPRLACRQACLPETRRRSCDLEPPLTELPCTVHMVYVTAPPITLCRVRKRCSERAPRTAFLPMLCSMRASTALGTYDIYIMGRTSPEVLHQIEELVTTAA